MIVIEQYLVSLGSTHDNSNGFIHISCESTSMIMVGNGCEIDSSVGSGRDSYLPPKW